MLARGGKGEKFRRLSGSSLKFNLAVIRGMIVNMALSDLVDFEKARSARRELLGLYDGGPQTAGRTMTYDTGFNLVWWLRSGWAEFTFDGERQRVGAGDWAIMPFGRRTQTFSNDVRLWSVGFAWEAAASGLPVLELRRPLVLRGRKGADLVEPAERLAREVARIAGNPALALWKQRQRLDRWLPLERVFLEWLEGLSAVLVREGAITDAPRELDPRVWQARRLLDATPMEGIPDYAGVAREVGLSREQLRRLFKAAYRVTMHRHVNRRRVTHAVARLVESDGRVKVVAAELGFTSLAKFSMWFRRHRGVSPREHRQAAGFSS